MLVHQVLVFMALGHRHHFKVTNMDCGAVKLAAYCVDIMWVTCHQSTLRYLTLPYACAHPVPVSSAIFGRYVCIYVLYVHHIGSISTKG